MSPSHSILSQTFSDTEKLPAFEAAKILADARFLQVLSNFDSTKYDLVK